MVKPKRTYSAHGLNALKRQIRIRGYDAIDMRTSGAKELFAWRKQVVQDLGGNLTAAQETLVEIAVRTRMYLGHVDGWLTEQKTLVDRRAKSLYPALRERQALADSLVRVLKDLGLERKRMMLPPASLAARLSGGSGGRAGVPPKPRSLTP